MHFVQVCELREDGLVAKRDVDHAVVGKCAHGGNAGGLLAASEGSGGDEETGVFTPEAALLPLTTRAVEEGLPLSGEIAVASGNTEEDTVVLLNLLGSDNWDVGVLRWSIHFVENLLGQGLLNSVRIMSGLVADFWSAHGIRLTDTNLQSHQPI